MATKKSNKCPPGYVPTLTGGCKPAGAQQAIAATAAGAKMVAGAVKATVDRSKAKREVKKLQAVTRPPMKKGGVKKKACMKCGGKKK